MARATIDFGIDLGTTNSSIAVLRGTEVEIIKSNENSEITPSAVWIDKKDSLYVGRRAKERLIVDPDNAACEFKLLMGTTTEIEFKRNGRRMKPEELSAEVLKSLRSDVKQRIGEDIESAVITVPAAFELPQCKATETAARLAGLKLSPLLQEPVAAAMAYGFQSESSKAYWLVYDFGGGTFDAAIIQVRDGTIQVINHGGDNQLGGKLIDWRIIEDLILPRLTKDYELPDFNRGNKRWAAAFAKLKQNVEEAKIQVSRDSYKDILIDSLCLDANGETVQVEFDLTRSDAARLAEPFILRSINICKKVLAEKRLGAEHIEKILLVGGPTLAPYLREMLADSSIGMGIPLEYGIDPLTVVSRGAAIFAGTQRLRGLSAQPVSHGQFKLELEYQPIGSDTEPLVGGKVIPSDGQSLSGFTIEFINPDARPSWRSGKVNLSTEGIFMTNLWAEKGKQSTFQIELCDATGRRRETVPDHFTYTVGLTVTEQPNIHNVGVALANDQPLWFFEKGSPLPARRREVLLTAVALRRGQTGNVITIPVIEGNNDSRATRNRRIGTLEINAHEVNRDVPSGSEVEVTLVIDESRQVQAKAWIPILDNDQEFEVRVNLLEEVLAPEKLRGEVERETRRLDELRDKALQVSVPRAEKVLEQIEEEEIERDLSESLTASGTDPNAASTCQHRMQALRAYLDEIEDALEWPGLLDEAEDSLGRTQQIVQQYGVASEKQRYSLLAQETRRAVEARDPNILRRKIDDLSGLYYRVAQRQPDFWIGFLEHLEQRRGHMTDAGQAAQLFNRANRAINDNEFPVLESSVRQLLNLLPEAERQDAEKAYGSTVIKS